jgi:hypothetical protein
VLNEGFGNDSEARRLLLGAHKREMGRVDRRADDKPHRFMAVGAGHLSGDDSVQTFVRSRAPILPRAGDGADATAGKAPGASVGARRRATIPVCRSRSKRPLASSAAGR